MHKDGMMARGTVNLVLRDEQGKVKQHKTVRNKITNQGLAHIVGRMIDSGEDREAYAYAPSMMKFMGLGIGTGSGSAYEIDGIATAVTPSATDTALQKEVTCGTIANQEPTSGKDDVTLATPTPLPTFQSGRVDMSRSGNLLANSSYLDANGNPSGIAAGDNVGHVENKIYQANEFPANSGVLQEDTGITPEGSYVQSDGTIATVGSVAQTRKSGDRLVYRAFFGENHPSMQGITGGSQSSTAAGSNGPVSLPITEAGIFNKQAMIAANGRIGSTDFLGHSSQLGLNKDQSMLCRTRFKQVNKAPQVTWSIKIADQT